MIMIANYALLYYKGDYKQSLLEIEKEDISVNHEALIYKSMIYFHLQKYVIADTIATTVLDSCLKTNDRIYELGARYVKSRTLMWEGKFKEGLELLNIDESSYQDPEYNEHENKKALQWLAYLKLGQGIILWRLNNLNNALENFFSGLTIVQKIDYQPLIGSFFNNIGIMYDLQGDLHKSLEYYEQGLKIKRHFGNQQGIFFIRNNIGILLTKKGELDQALTFFDKNLQFLNDQRSLIKSMWRVTYANLSKIYHIQNDFEKALIFNNKALEIAIDTEDYPAMGYDLFRSILIFLETGSLEKADQSLRQLNDLRKKTSDPNIEIDYQISTGLIHKSSKRIRNLGKALEIFENLAKQEIEPFETKIFILYELIELLIMNYQLLPSPELLTQVSTVLSDIMKLSEQKNTYPLIIETLIIKAKLNLALSNLTLSHNLLERALNMAKSMKLTIYIQKIQREFENLKNLLEKWSNSMSNTKTKIDELFLIDYLNTLSRIIK